jgi:LPS export ABC transporter protein LptC
MTQQIKQILFFTLLTLLSYAVIKYFFSYEKPIADKPFTKGYSIENIEMKITDDEGLLTAEFKAPTIIRYTDDPKLFINKPLFWLFNNGEKNWVIQSNKAEYNAESENVTLIGDLIAKSTLGDSFKQFEAKNLTISLKDKIAKTEDGISLKQQQFTMTGQIANFDLKNDILEVNTNVKAIYKPIEQTHE